MSLQETAGLQLKPIAYPFVLSLPVLSLSKGRRTPPQRARRPISNPFVLSLSKHTPGEHEDRPTVRAEPVEAHSWCKEPGLPFVLSLSKHILREDAEPVAHSCNERGNQPA